MSKRIAIIGAGWMGIGVLSVLIQKYTHIDVYEKMDDVGGVWHPNNWYTGLSIHGPALTVEYHDFPLPDHIDKTKNMPASEIYHYLRSYCEFKKLYNNINFNTNVNQINYNSKKNNFTLDVNGEMIEYDYIIYTHGFTDRTLPKIKDQQLFTGFLKHSFDVNETVLQSIIRENKKVTIIGGGKTATDLVLAFSKYQYKITWLYRKNYWFFRESIYQNILKKIISKRKINLQLFLYLFIHWLTTFFGKKNHSAYFSLFKLFNFIHTYGKKHRDFKKYHGGRIEDAAMHTLKVYNKKYYIEGEIDGFISNGIKLKNGKIILTDYVVFCTGSSGSQSLIPIYIDNELFSLDTVHKLYRSRVIPQIPGLIFTAFSDFNIGTINGLIYGNWISKYIEGNFSKSYLEKHSIQFDKPFFSSLYLFDSKEYFRERRQHMLSDFFKSGELCPTMIKKWSRDYQFSGHSLKPYDFSEPQII